jgi:hypothetical protein
MTGSARLNQARHRTNAHARGLTPSARRPAMDEMGAARSSVLVRKVLAQARKETVGKAPPPGQNI